MARVGLLAAIVSSVADTIYEMSGRLIVRSTAVYVAGDGSITVEGTHRWPTSGRIAVAGTTGYYASKTATSLDGLTDENGDPGLLTGARAGSVVTEISQAETDVDLVRRSFFVAYAEGVDLDTLGRNYGLHRPRGIDDDTWRALLQVMIYLDAQTIRACVKVLDALLGPGNYEIYEDLVGDPLTVHVVVAASAANDPTGRTYLQSGEAAASAGNTVTVLGEVAVVYGIYDNADPYRTGTNYAMETVLVDTFAANPRYLFGAWTAADEGKPVIKGNEAWRLSVLDVVTAQAVGEMRDDGILNAGDPDVIATAVDWWRNWMIGHQVAVLGARPGNAGIFTIAAILSSRSAQLTGAGFLTESPVSWRLVPAFPDAAGVSIDVLRATSAGTLITAPGALPANVLVDYTTLPSAEVMTGVNTDGAPDAAPFFLWDDTANVAAVLDLVVAAGVEVVVETS